MTTQEARAAEATALDQYRSAKALLQHAETTGDRHDKSDLIAAVNNRLHDYHEARLKRQLAQTAEEHAQRTAEAAAAETERQKRLPKPTHIPGDLRPKWLTPH